MAKSLVRNRHAITKMYQLKSQLQAVSLRMAVSTFLIMHHVQCCTHAAAVTPSRHAGRRGCRPFSCLASSFVVMTVGAAFCCAVPGLNCS